MAIERSRSNRKATGGRLVSYRKGRQFAKVFQPILTKLGLNKLRTKRTIGGSTKRKLAEVNTISVAIPSKKTVKTTEIESVEENKANRNYHTRNIMNKGAIVKTKLGNVRITSRPGQTGSLSGVLVE